MVQTAGVCAGATGVNGVRTIADADGTESGATTVPADVWPACAAIAADDTSVAADRVATICDVPLDRG
jgi:hypothetical protein